MPKLSTNPAKTAHLTAKQLELLRVIVAGNEDGSACDLDQILDRIRYCTTKDSLQFSIRILIQRELVEKLPIEQRRGAARRVIGATEKGKLTSGRPRASAPAEQNDIVEMGGDILSADLEPVLDFIAPEIL